MKNKLLILICLVLSALLVFASCGEAPETPGDDTTDGGNNDGNNDVGNTEGDNTEGDNTEGDNTEGGNTDCRHTFAEEWSTNATEHWHQATCEHGEVKDALAAHADADEDGFCDVCAYEVGHVHTYVDEWSSDLENHWKAASCSHKDRVGELGLHYDDNSDAKCDACGAHVHVLSSGGKCLGCGEQIKVIDTSNISSLIQTVADHYDNVKSGKITSSFTGIYGTGSHSTKTAKVIEYMFGNGSAYFKEASAAEVVGEDREGTQYEANTYDLVEKWRNLEEDGSIYGVYRETVGGVAGDFYMDGSASEDTLYGYYFSVSTLANGYGAEGILKALYERSQEDSASNFVYSHEEGTKTYQFSFESTLVNTTSTSIGLVTNANYFVTSVEFTYDDNYVLTNLKITCDCYTSDGGAKIVKNEETGESEYVLDENNVDLDYDAATGTVTLRQNAKADTYVFEVEQVAGERTFVNEYTKAYFAPAGFDIYTDETFETLAEENITLAKGTTSIKLWLHGAGEDGQDFSSVAQEELTLTCISADGTSAPFFYNPISSRVMFYSLKTGTYTITVAYGGVTKTINLTVG